MLFLYSIVAEPATLDTNVSTNDLRYIEGNIWYAQEIPDGLPKESCMVIRLFETDDERNWVTKEIIYDPLKTTNIAYSLKIAQDVEISLDRFRGFKISALLNVGWCSENTTNQDGVVKEADYSTPGFYTLGSVDFTGGSQGVFKGPDIFIKRGK